jgi:hypothetical protein
LLWAALAAVPCLAATIFTDGTFSLASYTQTTFTSNTGPAGATYSVTQSVGSGNPAPSLDFNVAWNVNTTFTVFVGLINNGFTYNPATGAISTIDFALDKNVTFTDSIVVQTNATYTPLLEQGGKFYLDAITGPALVQGTWQNVSATALTASNFSFFYLVTGTLDSTQHPDFSTAGGLICFGIRVRLGYTNALGTGSFDSLSDNLSFAVNTVPEPSSLWLVIASLACLAVWYRLPKKRT